MLTTQIIQKKFPEVYDSFKLQILLPEAKYEEKRLFWEQCSISCFERWTVPYFLERDKEKKRPCLRLNYPSDGKCNECARSVCRYDKICFVCGEEGHGAFQVYAVGKLKGQLRCTKHRNFLDQMERIRDVYGFNENDIRQLFLGKLDKKLPSVPAPSPPSSLPPPTPPPAPPILDKPPSLITPSSISQPNPFSTSSSSLSSSSSSSSFPVSSLSSSSSSSTSSVSLPLPSLLVLLHSNAIFELSSPTYSSPPILTFPAPLSIVKPSPYFPSNDPSSVSAFSGCFSPHLIIAQVSPSPSSPSILPTQPVCALVFRYLPLTPRSSLPSSPSSPSSPTSPTPFVASFQSLESEVAALRRVSASHPQFLTRLLSDPILLMPEEPEEEEDERDREREREAGNRPDDDEREREGSRMRRVKGVHCLVWEGEGVGCCSLDKFLSSRSAAAQGSSNSTLLFSYSDLQVLSLQLVEALHVMHSTSLSPYSSSHKGSYHKRVPLLHRNIRPSSILVVRGGRGVSGGAGGGGYFSTLTSEGYSLKLTDPILPSILQAQTHLDPSVIPHSSSSLSSFCAPELGSILDLADPLLPPSTDLFSLGQVIFSLATGRQEGMFLSRPHLEEVCGQELAFTGGNEARTNFFSLSHDSEPSLSSSSDREWKVSFSTHSHSSLSPNGKALDDINKGTKNAHVEWGKEVERSTGRLWGGLEILCPPLFHLILVLTRSQPSSRLPLSQARCHPFFWGPQSSRQIVEDVSSLPSHSSPSSMGNPNGASRDCILKTSSLSVPALSSARLFALQMDRLALGGGGSAGAVFPDDGWAGIFPLDLLTHPMLPAAQSIELRNSYPCSCFALLHMIRISLSLPDMMPPVPSPTAGLQPPTPSSARPSSLLLRNKQITLAYPYLFPLIFTLGAKYGVWSRDGDGGLSHSWSEDT